MQRNCLLFLAAVLTCQYMASGQGKQYSFTHYGVTNGLAAYNARAIVQDETGFIWIGTINGLQRFDGTRFVTFRHNPADSNSIPDNYVDQLLIDKDNQLWLVFADGSIGIFDTKRFIFKKALVQLSNKNNLQAFRKLMQDEEGNIFYIFPNTELLTYSRRTNEYSAANNIFTLPLNWKVINIVQDRATKKYWIGTDSGMAIYNNATKTLSYYGNNKDHEPFIEQHGKVPGVGCYAIDKKRRCWFWSWPLNRPSSKLYCYDLKNNSTILADYDLGKKLNRYIEPDYFLEQKDGNTWLGGLNVLVKYNEPDKSFQPVNNGSSMEQNIYFERALLFEDRQQNIWIATTNNGVYVFNPSQQRLFTSTGHINRLSGNNGAGYLLTFVRCSDGSILTSSWGDGLYRYDSNLTNIPLAIKGISEKESLQLWDFCKLKDKNITWMAGQPGLIYIYDEQTNIATKHQPGIFESQIIRQVEEDRSGNIWIGTQNRGLFKWMPSKASKDFEAGFYKINAIPNLRIKKITIDNSGFVWVCTNKEGLYRIDPGTDSITEHITKNSPSPKKLLNNEVSSILEYNDSIMIIASGGLCIYNRKTGSISHITSTNGLPSDAVASIEKDKSGYIWLGLINGICRMNPEKNTFSFFDRSDGIANDNFMVAASYQLPDGRMLFGSSDDFVVFKPDDIKTGIPPPDVTITDFKVMNKSLLVDSLRNLKKIELPADQYSVSIGFAGLSYLDRSKTVYYYIMDGIDKEWKKANELNQAVYNYLPAGNYTFKVKSENADGISGKNVTMFLIKVRPPFWKTWWFVSLLGFASIGLFYWLDKFRVARIRDTQRVRTRIANSLTKDMSRTLGNINMLSELAKVKAERDIERTKEYIGRISDSSNRMMDVMDDMIWSINPENDEMQYTIIRMRKYATEIQSRYNLAVSFNISEKVKEIKLQMDKRHELLLIYKEALLNAARHGGSKSAWVDVGCDSQKIKLNVVDNGKGFKLAEVSICGGISDMRKRAAALNAHLVINSDINTGTSILLSMPV